MLQGCVTRCLLLVLDTFHSAHGRLMTLSCCWQTQQEKAETEREAKRRREQVWKKKERERIAQGKRPFFLKKCKNLPSLVYLLVLNSNALFFRIRGRNKFCMRNIFRMMVAVLARPFFCLSAAGTYIKNVQKCKLWNVKLIMIIRSLPQQCSSAAAYYCVSTSVSSALSATDLTVLLQPRKEK